MSKMSVRRLPVWKYERKNSQMKTFKEGAGQITETSQFRKL